MFNLGILLLIIGGLLCWFAEIEFFKHRVWLRLLLTFAALFLGTYFTRHSPYIAVIGLVCVVISFTRFIDSTTSSALRRLGSLVMLASLAVVIIGLFKRPSQSIEIEDRSDWQAPPIIELTPRDLLALNWSTSDKSCHWPVSKLMLELCDVAYQAPVDARKRLEEIGFQSETIMAGAMQGYVLDAGDDSIVILRGTEKHEYDILQDLRFLKSTSDQGSMHGGFVSGYAPMHSQIKDLLARFDTKRVWITGHSLGGGLAIVCAHQLLVDGKYPIAGIMTFGQPMVVRDDMRNYLEPKLDGKYVFFVNDMDPVTRVVEPYTHFGHMVRWTDTEIERSKRNVVVMSNQKTSTSTSDPVRIESGYVESMDSAKLDEFINKLEEAKKPKYDKDGNQLMEGYFPNVFDHFLDSYSGMLEHLRTHKGSPK